MKITSDKMKNLMLLMKTVTAMKLTKEDSTPCPVLSRRVAKQGEEMKLDESESPFVPSKPIHPDSVSESYNLMDPEEVGEPCLFQGSVGTAFNLESLQACGITHILTAASNINPRFKDKGITYKILALLDSPTQNIVKFFEEAY